MKAWIRAAGVVFGSLIASAASAASFNFTEETTFPGTACRSFAANTGPNSGAELGNWSGALADVFCPLPRDSASPYGWSAIHVDTRPYGVAACPANLNNLGASQVCCLAWLIEPNGGGWGWSADNATPQSGYEDLYWGQKSPNDSSYVEGAALECHMGGGGTIINNYRVQWDVWKRN